MIGDQVWIGMNVTILKSVTIGEGAIIVAGSVLQEIFLHIRLEQAFLVK